LKNSIDFILYQSLYAIQLQFGYILLKM